MNADTLRLALLLFGTVALGGLLPYTRRWSEDGLHALVALSAGIFLGSVFLHLVPELAAAAGHIALDDGHGHGRTAGGTGPVLIWGAFAGGLLGLWWLERRLVHDRGVRKGHDHAGEHEEPELQHQLAWRATLFGLSIHALLTGLGLAAIAERPGHWALWSAMLLHKLTEGFSLGTLLRLASLGVGRASAIVVGFALIAPGGLVLGRLLALELGPFADLLTAFAAGTFLFVALFELLPEVWHGVEKRAMRVGLVAVGVALAGVVPRAGQDALAAAAWAAGNAFLDLAPFLLVGLALAAWRRTAFDGRRREAAAAGTSPPVVLATWALFDPFIAALRFVGAWVSARAVRAVAAAVAPRDAGGARACAVASDRRPGPLAALVDALDRLGGSLVVGVLAAGVVVALVPEAVFASPWFSAGWAPFVLLAVAAALPIGALAATPIAAALVERGVTPGAALVFLLVAPVVSAPAFALDRRALRLRAVVVTLFVTAALALAFGAAVDLAHPHLAEAGAAFASPGARHVPDALRDGAGVALALLLAASFVRRLRRAAATPVPAVSAP